MNIINRFTKGGMFIILMILIITILLFTGCTLLKGVEPPLTGGEITNIPEAEDIPKFVEQEVLVRIKPGADIEKIVSEVGGRIIETLPQISVIRIKLESQVSVAEAIQILEKLEEVEYAEPNGICYMHLIPNDLNYNSQWAPQLTEAESAWEVTTGAVEVVIAITDTGVDGTHSDFGGKVMAGYDTFNNIAIPANTDSSVHCHGTHCAGIAAAVGNNSLGIAGVAWESKIMPIKICKDVPNYNATNSDMAEAFIWAADNEADIISCSFGGKGYSQTVKDAIDYAVIDNECIFIASMGNSSRDEILYPAGYQSVIAVGATDAHDEIASFSTTGDHISVCAPGVEIYSTMPGGGYDYLSGTSMSCPFVAGAAALILSQNPGMSPEEVKTQLEETAVDLGSLGFDSVFGYGRLDLVAAVGAVEGNKYGVVDVLVTDQLGDPISGASVILWQGETVISTTNSNEDGHAIFEYILSGEYGISASFPGFNSSLAAENMVIVVVEETEYEYIVLSSILASTEYRIILTWGENPRDLDSHLWIPNGEHCYYYNKIVSGANLDIDDVSSYGPETITITEVYSGTYTYSVKHYAGSGKITTSGATVKIYNDSGNIRTYEVDPNASCGDVGWYWTVFELDGNSGIITTINTFDSSSPRSINDEELLPEKKVDS